ncbi:MAG: sodium:calcium antiporter [Anaerolineae bacterium]
MIWIQFALSAVLIVIAAVKLAQYSDAISVRTGLGGMFIGTLLMAMATSLPELLTMINSINQEVPSLAAGNIFGSSMFNMFVLALLDLLYRSAYVLRAVAISHVLTASLAVLLTGLAVFLLLVGVEVEIGWVGLDSLALIAAYVGAVRLIQVSNASNAPPLEMTEAEIEALKVPTLRTAVIGFTAATVALVLVTPLLVSSSVGIAEATGLTTGFVGTTLVAIVTSLPEVVTTIAAARIGAFDLAVGNLFGSNVFNIFSLGLTDLFYSNGRFLGAIDPALAVAGLTALLLTCLASIAIAARVERRRFSLIGILVIVGYFGGMWLLFN